MTFQVVLETGKRYRIRHRLDSQRYDRVSVMTYLGTVENPPFRPLTQWNARPIAGTQTLPWSALLESEEVDPSTPVSLNKRAPQPTRPPAEAELRARLARHVGRGFAAALEGQTDHRLVAGPDGEVVDTEFRICEHVETTESESITVTTVGHAPAGAGIKDDPSRWEGRVYVLQLPSGARTLLFHDSFPERPMMQGRQARLFAAVMTRVATVLNR